MLIPAYWGATGIISNGFSKNSDINTFITQNSGKLFKGLKELENILNGKGNYTKGKLIAIQKNKTKKH